MLRAVVDVCAAKNRPICVRLAPAVRDRGRRYAAVLERMVSPEGTFPVLGRSITYVTRTAACAIRLLCLCVIFA